MQRLPEPQALIGGHLYFIAPQYFKKVQGLNTRSGGLTSMANGKCNYVTSWLPQITLLYSLKIDVPLFNIRVDKLHIEPLSNVYTF